MKNLFATVTLALMAFGAHAKPLKGHDLADAVVKAGICYTHTGAIVFFPNGKGQVIWTPAKGGSDSPYGPYGPYDPNEGIGDREKSKWRVSGARLFVLIRGEYKNVVIGLKSKTCDVN